MLKVCIIHDAISTEQSVVNGIWCMENIGPKLNTINQIDLPLWNLVAIYHQIGDLVFLTTLRNNLKIIYLKSIGFFCFDWTNYKQNLICIVDFIISQNSLSNFSKMTSFNKEITKNCQKKTYSFERKDYPFDIVPLALGR